MTTPSDNNPQEPSSASAHSAFVLVPAFFWQSLSPEEFKARQQVYQIAYEKARQKLGSEADYGEITFDI